jgi:hypothetical protein
MTSRERVLVQVPRWLEAYRELESLLGEKKRFRSKRRAPRSSTESGSGAGNCRTTSPSC